MIIAGSSNGAYERDIPWIPVVESMVQQAHRKIPILNICFGHQIIATALSGEVKKNEAAGPGGGSTLLRSAGCTPVPGTPGWVYGAQWGDLLLLPGTVTTSLESRNIFAVGQVMRTRQCR